MAGRLVPIAIATVTGIATGVAIFDPELKYQRKKRLEEEYRREVAALGIEGSPATPENAVKPQEQHHPPSNATGISSMLGLWAWEKGGSPNDTASKESHASSTLNGSSRQS